MYPEKKRNINTGSSYEVYYYLHYYHAHVIITVPTNMGNVTVRVRWGRIYEYALQGENIDVRKKEKKRSLVIHLNCMDAIKKTNPPKQTRLTSQKQKQNPP